VLLDKGIRPQLAVGQVLVHCGVDPVVPDHKEAPDVLFVVPDEIVATADLPCKLVRDIGMSGKCFHGASTWVCTKGVRTTFPLKDAAMETQVSEELCPLHERLTTS
jgi:hypothetical protein